MHIKGYWLYVFLGLTLIAFFFYRQNQAHLSYDFAPEFDGNDYRNIYEYFTGLQEEYNVEFPFHQRILVPWLASLINSGDIIKDFQIVNLIFSLLAVWVLFSLWRKLGFELKWFWAGFIWLLFHWTGLIRLNAFDPITVDVPIYCFQGLLLLFILRRKFLHLLWLAPLATLQKESFLALIFVLVLYAWYHNWKSQEGYYHLPTLVIALVLSIGAKLTTGYFFPPQEEGKDALITLVYHAKEAVLNPFELLRWLAAMGVAFGPLLFLTFFKTVKTFRFDHTRNLLMLFSLVYLAFGILAGGDMTRIIFLGFPFIASWMAYELKDYPITLLVITGLLTLSFMQLGRIIPDPAFQWDLWVSQYPEFAPRSFVFGYLFYLLATSVAIGYGFRKYLKID